MKPKLPSQMHPHYPKPPSPTVDERGLTIHYPIPFEALHAFYKAHPEFDDEGEYVFECEMCGSDLDDDLAYCFQCDDHAGSWTLR